MWSNAERVRRALGASLIVGLASAIAVGDPVDPGIPIRRVVGEPGGAAPMARVDGARTGRARSRLPHAPRLAWRARVQGGTDLHVAIDARGAVVVASALGQLVQFSASGKLVWSTRTGPGAPLAGPVIASDGTRVLLVAGPAVVGVWPDGRPRYRRAVGVANDRPASEPLALDDGSVAIALGRDVLRLEPDGSVRARTRVEESAASLVARAGSVLVVGERGSVWEWRAGNGPTRLGSFAGRIDGGAALFGLRTLSAVVDKRRVIDLDLATGARHVRLDDTAGLAGPPALTRSGETRLATADGVLLGHDAAGKETARVALEPGAGSLVGSSTAPIDLGAPPIVVDDGGQAAFARPGIDAAVVDATGAVHAASGTACSDPVDVAPAGAGRMLVACRSGLLFLISDTAR